METIIAIINVVPAVILVLMLLIKHADKKYVEIKDKQKNTLNNLVEDCEISKGSEILQLETSIGILNGEMGNLKKRAVQEVTELKNKVHDEQLEKGNEHSKYLYWKNKYKKLTK